MKGLYIVKIANTEVPLFVHQSVRASCLQHDLYAAESPTVNNQQIVLISK